jgi:hypothetical protein
MTKAAHIRAAFAAAGLPLSRVTHRSSRVSGFVSRTAGYQIAPRPATCCILINAHDVDLAPALAALDAAGIAYSVNSDRTCAWVAA